MTTPSSEAWLEAADGRRTDVNVTLTFGRSGKNDVVLSHHGASRRHALLNRQHDGEFWLVDLGSINGTCVNGRRIFQPVRLRAGDCIELAGHTFLFRESARRPNLSAVSHPRPSSSFAPKRCGCSSRTSRTSRG
jgi:pSer/pThr/pTyr-binding forkhead associated (FHA) protein